MASSSMNPNQKHEHWANETRGEQALEQFISARNEQGQVIPMGGRDYKDYGGSSSKDYTGSSSKDYGGAGNKDFKDKSEDKSNNMWNMLWHIENLEAKLAGKEKQLMDAYQWVEKFSVRTR